MEEREHLIQQLDQAREKLRAELVGLDTQIEIYPTWTIKQMLAHITGWDDATLASLQAHAAGREPAVPASQGINFYNAQTVETRQALSYQQVVQEWELTREQLKTVIREMRPEKLAEPLVLPWGLTGTVAQVVAIFADHEEEHAREIQKFFEHPSHDPT